MPTIKRQLEPVPFTDVTFDDTFWAPRIEVNRTVTILHIYRQCEATGRISAFDLNFQRPVPSPIVLILRFRPRQVDRGGQLFACHSPRSCPGSPG